MNRTRWMTRILMMVLPLAAVILAGCGVFNLTPQFSHQGRLLDDEGTPVADGDYEVRYNIYHALTGGTAVYTDTQTVAVADGLFTTSLGLTETMTPTIFAQPTWMEITVDGETLTPRQRLQGAPYAFSLVTGAVVQGAEPLDRSFAGQDDTGAVVTVWNRDGTATGGHGLLALNQAAAAGADRAKVAAFQAIAAGGQNSEEPQTGAYGAIIRSDHWRGMYAEGSSGFYAAVFDSSAGIDIIGGGNCSGCTLAYVAQNVGSEAIAAGDFVAVDGVTLDTDLNIPVMQVRKATAGSSSVVGVASSALSRSPVGEYNGVTTGGYEAAGKTAAPGDYVSIAVQGLVQANAGTGATLDAGDGIAIGVDGTLTAAGNGIARAMSGVDADGLVWVMLSGQ